MKQFQSPAAAAAAAARINYEKMTTIWNNKRQLRTMMMLALLSSHSYDNEITIDKQTMKNNRQIDRGQLQNLKSNLMTSNLCGIVGLLRSPHSVWDNILQLLINVSCVAAISYERRAQDEWKMQLYRWFSRHTRCIETGRRCYGNPCVLREAFGCHGNRSRSASTGSVRWPPAMDCYYL